MGYKEGCKFKINLSICNRTISKRNAQMLLETKKTALIKGFISKKSGKSFDAFLSLKEDGNIVFEFN